MKEEFVSYEQAKALKELGFHWKVNNGYSVKLRLEPEVSYGESKEVHSKDPKNFNDNRKGIDKGVSFYSAPTQALAQKWLREVKGIAINVIAHDGGKYHWELIFLPNSVETVNFAHLHLTEYNSYESALSQGISAALNLLTDKQ